MYIYSISYVIIKASIFRSLMLLGLYLVFVLCMNFQEKLAKWEYNRENERRKLLMEEAELKQKDSWTALRKHQSKLFGRWMFR